MSSIAGSLPKLQETNDKLKLLSDQIDQNSVEIIQLINSLQSIPCTPADLKASQLNLVINTLRRSSNDQVVTASKNIINHWKASAGAVAAQSNSNPTITSMTLKEDPNTLVQLAPPTPLSSPPSTSAMTDIERANSKRSLQQPFILGQTGSKNRDAIQKLFYSVFDTETVDPQLSCELAISIEEGLLKRFMTDGQDYKDRARLLLANLKDPKNADFRESIIDGFVDPHELATISQADMASNAVKEQLKKQADYQLEARKTDLGGGQGVDMFPCPKCKGRNTSFFQKQTRSADEPMTIFCTCLLCRQKWRIY